jgi:3',5'-nucleoside bisphosphate phosphatase
VTVATGPARSVPARDRAIVADLHSHSTVSDGWYEPAQVVALQGTHGVNVVAITDHDTLAGVPAARERALTLGLGYVVAAEITAAPPRGMNHLLAHGVAGDNPDLGDLLARNRRIWRAEVTTILVHVRRQGLDLPPTLEAISDLPMVMPNTVARELIRSGRVRHDDIWAEIHRALPSVPASVYRHMPGPLEIAEVVHSAGGLVVWAHPGQSEDPDPMRQALRHFDAVEVYTPRHDRRTVAELEAMCHEQDLPASTGVDFHGYPDRYRPPPVPLDRRYLDLLWQRIAWRP